MHVAIWILAAIGVIALVLFALFFVCCWAIAKADEARERIGMNE